MGRCGEGVAAESDPVAERDLSSLTGGSGESEQLAPAGGYGQGAASLEVPGLGWASTGLGLPGGCAKYPWAPIYSTFQIESVSNKCVLYKSDVDVKISAEGKAR